MKETAPKPFVFVLMPLAAAFDDVYALGIKAACESAGAYCERVDEQIFHESILQRIYNQIAKADLIVADMSGRNPNVFYEVGYAHALGKAVILLTEEASDIPFDLKHYPHIVYAKSVTKLRSEVEARVRWYLAHPTDSQRPSSDALEIYFGGTLCTDGQELRVPVSPGMRSVGITADIAVHNGSARVLRNPLEELGLVVPPCVSIESSTDEEPEAPPIILPNGYRLISYGQFKSILPDAWESVQVKLVIAPGIELAGTHLPITVKLFTEFGPREHMITLRFELTDLPDAQLQLPYTGFRRTWQAAH